MSSSFQWLPSPAKLQADSAGIFRVLSARFVAIVVALHAPSWLTAWVFQARPADERPLFNLDLLMAAAIACVSAWAGGVVLALAWAADFIRAASKNYHFMSAVDLLDAARFLSMLNLWTFSTSVLAIAGALLACMWLVLRQARNSPWMALPFMAAAVLAAGCDVVNGSFHIFGLDKDSRTLNMNFAGSPAWNVWRSERQSLLAPGGMSPLANPITFRALRDWQATHPGETSMLIVVESMGLPSEPALQSWLRSRLKTRRLAARWVIHQGEESFMGSTTYGELRALCGLQGHYSKLDGAHAAGCLPDAFAAHGVTSVGIHGFGLRMFDRNDWWPKINLQPWHWAAGSISETEMACNQAFPGVCDRAVLSLAVRQVQQPKRFVYALTLDTHLPLRLQIETLPEDLRAACTRAKAPESACRLVQRLGQVLDELEQQLAMSRATPFIAITGDHSPPFAEAANRQVFDAGRVPVILLYPKEVRLETEVRQNASDVPHHQRSTSR